MADPTFQTFCCHEPSKNDSGIIHMLEFNTDSYNTVSLISSSLGILGALYQILPRQEPTQAHRWFSSATRGRRILVWLAIADLMASLGVFVRAALWLKYKKDVDPENDTISVLFCAISSAWIQYFYTVTWMWTLCYAIDMRLVLKERPGWPGTYHAIAWVLPAFLTTIGLSILYLPDANCQTRASLAVALTRVLPNYCATYVPLAVVMIVCPALYMQASHDVQRVVACGMGQYTRKERNLVDAVRVKFAFINIALYVCWLPNLINSFLLWVLWSNLPADFVVSLWYTMAATNPLQAAFNSLVYRSWSGNEKVYLPCRRRFSVSSASPSTTSPSAASEATPLLQKHEFRVTGQKCINGSSADDH